MGHRLLRINESIKETLSSVITAEGLKDPRVGFVTVTGVKTSPDQRHAKVYVSVLGKQAEREATMKALDKSRGFLQARINASLHMKRTPQLEFVYDGTLDNALHIDGKMGSLKRFAEDAREVAEGFECGILLDGFNDLKEGDVLEAYETREVAREA
ncbi:MAG: 30S ribosome-binding factor RbfA [Actinobacteria bacterium]|nr:30S ribosome-binding factor RbfA [Actinomycetota bacterium]